MCIEKLSPNFKKENGQILFYKALIYTFICFQMHPSWGYERGL